MSVLIKGMDMPKNCIYCPLSHWNKLDEITGCEIVAGKKYVDKEDSDYWDSSDRPKWCPLVEIPKHGRLIDADDVLTQTRHSDWVSAFEQGEEYGWNKAIEYVGNFAPTIIEAEE